MGICNGQIESKYREIAYMLQIHTKQELNNWCYHLPNDAYSNTLKATTIEEERP